MSLLVIGSFETTSALRATLIAAGLDGGAIAGATAAIGKRFSIAREALRAGQHAVVTGVLADCRQAGELFALAAERQRCFLLGLPVAPGSPLQALANRSQARVDLATIRGGWSGDEDELIDGITRELVACLRALPDGPEAPQVAAHRSDPARPCGAVWVTLSFPSGPSIQLELDRARKLRRETIQIRGDAGLVRHESAAACADFAPVAARFLRSRGRALAASEVQAELARLAVVDEVRSALESARAAGW